MQNNIRNVKVVAESNIDRGDGDTERIVLTADGTLEDTGDKLVLRYTESVGEGIEATDNEVSFFKEKRGEVTVSRSGGVSSLMYFCAGSRYNWQYDAGFITIDFCTNTKELVNNLDYSRGGVFEVFYIMENRGVEMQRVKFSLTVK